DEDGCFEPGVAGLLNVVRRGTRIEPGAEHAFAGQVEVPAVLEHRARDYLAQHFAREAEAGDQPIQRRGEHVLIGRARVAAVRASKRDTVAAHNGHPPGRGHSSSQLVCMGTSDQVGPVESTAADRDAFVVNPLGRSLYMPTYS